MAAASNLQRRRRLFFFCVWCCLISKQFVCVCLPIAEGMLLREGREKVDIDLQRENRASSSKLCVNERRVASCTSSSGSLSQHSPTCIQQFIIDIYPTVRRFFLSFFFVTAAKCVRQQQHPTQSLLGPNCWSKPYRPMLTRALFVSTFAGVFFYQNISRLFVASSIVVVACWSMKSLRRQYMMSLIRTGAHHQLLVACRVHFDGSTKTFAEQHKERKDGRAPK